MMNRTTFNENIKSLVEKTLGDNYNVELQKVTKVNETLDAIIVRKKTSPIGVSIYIDSFYDEYCMNNEDVTHFANKLLEHYRAEIVEASLSVADLDVLKDKRSVYHKIFYKIINKNKNPELLKTVPHLQTIENSDLVLIFCILIDESEHMRATVTITHQLMNHFDFTFSELVTVAKENTPLLFPVTFRPMSDVLFSLMPVCDTPIEEGKDFMWVLSNSYNTYGASALCYEHQLEQISHKLNGNFYILPSSLHEVIIVKDNNNRLDSAYLCEMVREINQTSVNEEDFLSDTVFYYNCSTHTLSIA